ncbi:hypothetical protein DGG96_12560 [Legionella qingyii]|uniref:Uncharacterized protein n=1 Tax=Legionella qingyii TaxID=2184757 RepID=A0A317TZV4_9GAMM|nr:hypothetical protein [Legionella qingyii]PWY55293.1 hypothetical protein DGG96_12560 [Legionella qingyii]RUR22786.1 hypothetical protein ELY20_08680 [Legionella qingyii]RUR23855.1 hypothetical protein ELY16_12710 [Legionella qingyii]
MNGENADNELSHWFSTYGVITAERILGRYKVNLAQSELVEAIKSPYSFYHRILRVPLKSVLNGIVLQQANDYHVYTQKLFIDYLLSGENSKGEEAQGASIREDLENERQQLVTVGDEFHNVNGQHDYLIAHSQAALIRVAQIFNAEMEKAITALRTLLKSTGLSEKKSKIRQAINHALIYCNILEIQDNQYLFIEKMNEVLNISLTEDLEKKMLMILSEILQIDMDFDEQISDFVAQTEELSRAANSYRTLFYETILRVVELMKSLPDYKIDPEQDAINRQPLYFDKTIGALE